MSWDCRDNSSLSREAASPVEGDVVNGRSDQPQPSTSRGKAPLSASGQGNSPQPEIVFVVPSRPSLPFALGGNIDFQDEVIEAIRNLPESHSDSIKILMGSDSSQ
ncbi:UNVERIFIED_CONTAM: hypothetical protein Sradi_3587100 [Sesamum radiatum]|uniref:Uncharacterized protein n=1 Tax=Sesamum radiatum TaxID=300843 RepID=A0AAW2QHB9_SESRA